MNDPKIIVIEGPDRVGKQTQTRLLRDHIRSMGYRAETIEVPIRSAITYRLIYWMLQNGLAKKLPKVFQYLQYLNRKIFQLTTLKLLSFTNNYLIFDRWSLSTVVYGSASGLSEEFTVGLMSRLKTPDHTFILYGKSYMKEAEDVYESDSVLQTKVGESYALWANRYPQSNTLINCNHDKMLISKKIRMKLESLNILPEM